MPCSVFWVEAHLWRRSTGSPGHSRPDPPRIHFAGDWKVGVGHDDAIKPLGMKDIERLLDDGPIYGQWSLNFYRVTPSEHCPFFEQLIFNWQGLYLDDGRWKMMNKSNTEGELDRICVVSHKVSAGIGIRGSQSLLIIHIYIISPWWIAAKSHELFQVSAGLWWHLSRFPIGYWVLVPTEVLRFGFEHVLKSSTPPKNDA